MSRINQAAIRLFTITAALALGVKAQQPQKPSDDVLRVNTELVQTPVTVVDKNGRSSTAWAANSSN
jgi:hypothetical protein